jgi:hypothetical protein
VLKIPKWEEKTLKKKKKPSLPSDFVFTWPSMPWELLKSPRSHEAVNWAFKIWEVPFWKAQFTSSQFFQEILSPRYLWKG